MLPELAPSKPGEEKNNQKLSKYINIFKALTDIKIVESERKKK